MSKTIKRISKNQLVALVIGGADVKINGNTFVNIETMTDASKELLKPKSNPFNGLQKFTVSNVQIFQNKNGSAYEAKVKRDLEKEGKNGDDFQLQPRTWGERIKNTPLVFHKGEFYLEVMFTGKVGDVKYFFEGKEIAKEKLTNYLRAKKEGNQGGLEKKVIIRTYKIESITAITIDKQKYVVM